MTIISAEFINNWVASPYALIVLSSLSLSESAFFIIPPEILLIPMALANKEMALVYGMITTIASVFGAALGYLIGKKGGQPILNKLFSKKKTDKVQTMFHRYDTGAIFISAFTPIPFKVFTIAAGVFDINFVKFITVSFLGRGTRYMLLAGLVYLFGDSVSNFLLHEFDKVIAIATVGLITVVGLYKIGIPFIEQKFLKETLKEKISRISNRFRKD
jgi:membrane protein YqaA with SNARE-associated domain